MFSNPPTVSDEGQDDEKKIYATPEEEPSPVPSPSPTPSVTPFPWQPWNPFPTWPTIVPSPIPSATPITKPSTIPSVWPVVKPSATPSTRPQSPEKNDRIEVPTNFFSLFMRPFGQSFGTFDDGHLEQPDSLPFLGQGFLKIFQERDRTYGSLDMISLIQASAQEIHREYPATEAVQVGDIAKKTGGEIRGHGSHQNGLDVDIAYFRKDRKVMPATGSCPGITTGFCEQFVDSKGVVTKNFDIETNWKFIQLLDSSGRLDRIFADRRLKKVFCEYAVAKGMRETWKETLRKLRHWPKHGDHMHVRMTCPPNSKKCRPFPSLPAGDGCASLLDASKRGIIRMDGELSDQTDSEDFDSNTDGRGC